MDNSQLLDEMAGIARRAGAAILEVYGQEDFSVETKADSSPLTAADLASHNLILEELGKVVPEIPILSEESDLSDFSIRASWQRYFLVDPLDGTKEFVNRNGEFTVNIALIEDHKPVLGVVYVPVQGKLYKGDARSGKATIEDSGGVRDIRVRAVANGGLKVVASRRHGAEALENLMTALAKDFTVDTENYGSSLKLCMIAEGRADLYPRFAPTSEWDTAAAQAVVEAAGGIVVDGQLQPILYNTKANILNPDFLVIADNTVDWSRYLP